MSTESSATGRFRISDFRNSPGTFASSNLFSSRRLRARTFLARLDLRCGFARAVQPLKLEAQALNGTGGGRAEITGADAHGRRVHGLAGPSRSQRRRHLVELVDLHDLHELAVRGVALVHGEPIEVAAVAGILWV